MTGKAIWRDRGRTILTVCGIAVGTVMLLAMTVIGDTGVTLLESEMNAMGLNGLSVSVADGGTVALQEEHLLAIRAIPSVSEAMPLMLKVGAATAHGDTESAVLCGVGDGANQTISLACLHGRLLQAGDMADGATVCVVDAGLARALYRRDNIVGKELRLSFGNGAVDFTVVGVSETDSTLLTNLTGYLPALVFVPYTTLATLTGDHTFFRIAIRAESPEAAELAEPMVIRTLDRLSGTEKGFQAENLAGQKEKLNRLTDAAQWIFAVIGAVSLLVSGIGMMTAMLSAVAERKREIGIKKAVGATRRHILSEFFKEAVVLSAVGGGIGVAVGLLAVAIAALTLPIAVSVSIPKTAAIWLFTVVIGGVFGAYPAFKASKLMPMAALREA